MREREVQEIIKTYFRRKGICKIAEILGFEKQEDGSYTYNGTLGSETDPVFALSEAVNFVPGDKANLDNQSGVNTGDETTITIQTKRPLKTIDGNSLEGTGDLSLNYKADQTDLDNHTNDTNNPHSVTQSQVGLGNVDNTSDLDKPISTATQNALDDKLNTSDFLEENIFGTLLEANVSGTYAIDFNSFADARLTMTGDTAFTIDDILNNSQVMVRGIKLTGQYVPTLPGTQINSEVYNGSALNRIIFDVNKLSNGTVEVFYTIEVI